MLWANPIEQVYYPNISTACQNSSMFGPTPWTGLIEPLSDSQRFDFRCSWGNPFGEGPFFNDYCRRNDGTITSGPCRDHAAPAKALTCEGSGEEGRTTPNGDKPVGDPASLSSGQKFERETDWTSPKDFRFSITRSYRTSFSVDRDMGMAWQSNWSDELRLYSGLTGWRLVRSNGDWHEFVDQDGQWNSSGIYQPTTEDSTITLDQNGLFHTATHPDGMVETFEARGNQSGNYTHSDLISRQWPDGYRIDVSYDAEGYIATLADNRGQTVYVTWFWPWLYSDGTPFTGVDKQIRSFDIDYDDPATTTPSLRLDYFYTYTPDAVLPGRIDRAEIHDLATGTFETLASYVYYDAYHGGFMMRLFDGKGVNFGTYDYTVTQPFFGNMIRSWQAGNVDHTLISYDTPYQSTVTNLLGRSTVYSFVDVPGVSGRRISTIDGVATPNCLATTQSLGYTPVPVGAPRGYIYERVNRNGSVTRYERNSRGLVTKETEDALGAEPRVTLKEWHPTLNLPTRITTSHLDEVFAYDASGILTSYSQTDVLVGSPSNGETRSWTFNYQTLASGLKVLSQIDGPGLVSEGVDDVTSYTYDAGGVLRTVTSAEGLVTEIVSVNPRGQPTLVRQPDGVETAFAYDYRGRLTSTTRDPNGAAATTGFTYDAIGQITSMTLPEGGVWSYTYDDARRLIQVENPLGEKILYSYDADGNVTHTEYQTAAGGVTFSFDQQYDELSRILATTGAEAQAWSFAHDVEDNLSLVTDPLGHTVQRGFDPLNRLVQLTDELSEVTTMDHDENDAVTAYTDPRGLATTTDYNGFGEVVSEDSPDRGVMTYSYNRRGLVETFTDGRGVELTYSYDDDGRMTARGDSGAPIDTPAALQADYALNAQTGAEYFPGSPQVNDLNTAAEENQVSVAKGAANYWDVGFADTSPALGSPTQVLLTLQYRPTNGWSGTFRAEYRVGAAVLASVDLPASGGQLGQFVWDLSAVVQSAADINGGTLRVLNLTTKNKAVRVSRSVLDTIQRAPGAPTGGQSFVWGTAGPDAGKLTLITDQSGSTARGHDSRGRIAFETRTIDGIGFDIDYGYDDEDLLTLITYPSGRQVQYVRDLAGQVTAVQQRADELSPWQDVATGIAWQPFGDLATLTRGNGVTYTAVYDQSYRLTGQTETAAGSLRDLVYDYSLRDNLTSASDLLDPAENATYGYDPRQMLESADGPWGELDWTYDGVGNRDTQSLVPAGGGSASLDLYTYAVDSNRLTRIDNAALGSREVGYDAAGNTTEELRALPVTEDWGYAYDAMGRLASVTLGSADVADYRYNALGQQVSRTVHFGGGAAAITLSVHDLNGNRLSEHDSGGVVLREYIWLDGRPLAVIESGQTFWLHWDHIGRPVMATDLTGTVVWAASYLPFGGIREVSIDTGALVQDLRFPGQWFQAETGLHQNWHRDYDPTTGRYLQADPLGLVDGPSVYGYARQNPLKYIDPEGRACKWVSMPNGNTELKCDRPQDLAKYNPSGLSSALSGAVNNTEFQECFRGCTRDLEVPDYVENACVGIAGAAGTQSVPTSIAVDLVCRGVGLIAHCESSCRRQCGID